MSLRWRIALSHFIILLALLCAFGVYLHFQGFVFQRVLFPFVVISIAGLGLFLWAADTIREPVVEALHSMRQIASAETRALSTSKDELGQLIEYLEAATSRLRNLQEELGDEREKSEAMLSGMADGIIVIDNNNRIVLFNRAAERIFNFAAGRVVGRAFVEAVIHEELSTMLERCLKHGAAQTGEIRLRSDRDRMIHAFVTRIETERGRGYGAVMVLHDLTEVRRLENIRRDFVANVSHELRTPIASIRAIAETLLLGGKDDPEAAESFLETIARETERLTTLLDDLLALARIESQEQQLELTQLDAHEVAQTVVSKLQPQAQRKGLQMDVNLPQAMLVRGNADAMQQVLINLLDNAIKYTPEGGAVRINGSSNGTGEAKISISDTGIGIPAADLERVFERFYRVDRGRSRELGGTGLGLSIVKHLMEAQHGHVGVESEPGRGTTFTLTFTTTSGNDGLCTRQ